ncbi:MAG TPA: c-type cytochrome [Steroidobacteraceae bacterium]|nr:c-type cytochrome [Steroidobacteraceae bacterium]
MRTSVLAFAATACLSTSLVPAQDIHPRELRDREFTAGAKLEPDLARGAELYSTCAACHGENGRGTTDGDIPAIAGQHGSVLLKQIADFRYDQRWNERMQHFTDQHVLADAQAVTDVAAYVAGLPRFSATTGIGDGHSLNEGAKVYFRLCEQCHGPLGQGDLLRRRPRLSGQHYAYLLRQMEETAGNLRPGMDDAHVQRMRKLSRAQMRGVADYLSRVSPDLSSQTR